MPPKFGTSGLRGLVTDLTPDLVSGYVRAFLAACPDVTGTVQVGRDLRASSPAIADVVIDALRESGVAVIDAGAVPTPALALSAMAARQGAIMITGSHIPADRNGLKFYRPGGEITKADETAILAALSGSRLPPPAPIGAPLPPRIADPECGARWRDRYVAAFGPEALAGLRIGVYQHSSVARDLIGDTLARLGAIVVPLARSDVFIPVDTEAVDTGTRAMLAGWAAEHRLDAITSTDGDADRPMLADASGLFVPGDVLGALTARALWADCIVTPVSSNTLVDALDMGARVVRTRIGSPYVIAAMESALETSISSAGRVVGYEPNGGFLLGFAAGPVAAAASGRSSILSGPLPPLMTRDCLLPILAPLATARAGRHSLAALVAALPHRFTATDRLQGVDPAVAAPFLARLIADPAARAGFFETGRPEMDIDTTDGLRITFTGGDIVHLRPSGNAPEFRIYAESGSAAAAEALVRHHFAKLDRLLMSRP